MYLIDALSGGGAQSHLIEVLRHLDYSAFEALLVCQKEAGRRFDMVKDLPVQPHVLDCPSLTNLNGLRALWKLRRLVAAWRPMVVHSFMFNPNVMAALACLGRSRPPFLITSRRDMGFWHRGIHWCVYRIINRRTDAVLAVCDSVREHTIAKEGLSAAKVMTVFNGVDLVRFQPHADLAAAGRARLGALEHDVVVGMLAVLRPEKRHDMFAAAARIVARQEPRAKFVVAGAGIPSLEDQLRETVAAADLGERFVFTGRLSDPAVILAGLDIVVLCSDTEGMSNGLLEAMAMGKPTVATAVGGNPEVVVSGETGLLVPPRDPEALAAAITQLIREPELRRHMGLAARERAVRRFDIRMTVAELQRIYASLGNSRA